MTTPRSSISSSISSSSASDRKGKFTLERSPHGKRRVLPTSMMMLAARQSQESIRLLVNPDYKNQSTTPQRLTTTTTSDDNDAGETMELCETLGVDREEQQKLYDSISSGDDYASAKNNLMAAHTIGESSRTLLTELGLDAEEQRQAMEMFEQQKRESERSSTISELGASVQDCSLDLSSKEKEEFGIDEEDQRYAMEYFEQQQQQQQKRETDIDDVRVQMVQVRPAGVEMPLRTPEETLVGISENNVVSITCTRCFVTYRALTDAKFMVCCDCWVFAPIPKSNGVEDSSRSGVCIGVSVEEAEQWLEKCNKATAEEEGR